MASQPFVVKHSQLNPLWFSKPEFLSVQKPSYFSLCAWYAILSSVAKPWAFLYHLMSDLDLGVARQPFVVTAPSATCGCGPLSPLWSTGKGLSLLSVFYLANQGVPLGGWL